MDWESLTEEGEIFAFSVSVSWLKLSKRILSTKYHEKRAQVFIGLY
jgi:hypothetical protein